MKLLVSDAGESADIAGVVCRIRPSDLVNGPPSASPAPSPMAAPDGRFNPMTARSALLRREFRARR